MPTNAPACKQAAVRGYGGTITLCEPNQASREATANALFNVCTLIHWHADAVQSLPSAAMIPPFDYVDVSLQAITVHWRATVTKISSNFFLKHAHR